MLRQNMPKDLRTVSSEAGQISSANFAEKAMSPTIRKPRTKDAAWLRPGQRSMAVRSATKAAFLQRGQHGVAPLRGTIHCVKFRALCPTTYESTSRPARSSACSRIVSGRRQGSCLLLRRRGATAVATCKSTHAPKQCAAISSHLKALSWKCRECPIHRCATWKRRRCLPCRGGCHDQRVLGDC